MSVNNKSYNLLIIFIFKENVIYPLKNIFSIYFLFLNKYIFFTIFLFCSFALMVNEKFKIIIAIQFIVSTLVICSNLYQLARITFNAQCFPLILYTCSMLTQILIYCWYGNEVKLKVRIICIFHKVRTYII